MILPLDELPLIRKLLLIGPECLDREDTKHK
jgi:hypothetical protein